MKFKIHLGIEIIIFLILLLFLGLEKSLIVTLFHFIPSVDFFMAKINLKKGLHRQLFHNIFIIIGSSLLLFYFTDLMVGILGCINLLFHITMDLGGNGVAIFYPLSSYRLKREK